MMKPCIKYRKELMLESYGELEPQRRDSLFRHLSVCAGCRRERSAMKNFIDRVSASRPIAVLAPSDAARMTENVLRAVKTEQKRGSSPRAGFFGLGSHWAPLAAAACLIVAVIGGWWVWSDRVASIRIAGAPGAEERVLVQDLEVIENLDLLEEFEELEQLVRLTGAPAPDHTAPVKRRTMGKEGLSGETRQREVA